MFTVLMTTCIYPIASAWTVGGGWLKELGFHDSAGAGYIHLLGGVCGFVGTSFLGPRIGIFEDKQKKNIKLAELKTKREKVYSAKGKAIGYKYITKPTMRRSSPNSSMSSMMD